MSTWLQSILTKRRIFLLQILSLSLIFHLVIILFFIFHTKYETVKFAVTRNFNFEVPILFIPFARTTGALTSNKRISSTRKSTHDPQIKHLRKPVKESVTKNKIVKKSEAKKNAKPKNNLINANKEKIKKLEAKKSKEIEVEEQKVKPVKEEKIVQEIIKEIEPIQNEIKLETKDNNLVEEPIIIGRNDLQVFDSYVEIQNQISELWVPPVGFSDLSCDVKILISNEGKIEKLAVEKSSGAVAFDASAKLAIKKIVWPQLCWGKEVILTFR